MEQYVVELGLNTMFFDVASIHHRGFVATLIMVLHCIQ